VAAGTVQLNPIQAGFTGVEGCLAELSDNLRDLVCGERTGLVHVDEAARVSEDLRVAADGGWCNDLGIVILVDARCNAAAMHELRNDQSAFRVNGICDLAPAFDLRRRIYARRAAIALASRARLRAFGDDETRTRTLAVIFDVQFGRRVALACPATGHG